MLDPRFSATWRLNDAVTLIGAAGVYHQFPEVLAYDPVFGSRGLAPMRATHAIAGMQLGTDARGVRIEVYDKQYSDLAQLDLLNRFVGGGVGRARGIDIMARDSLPLGFDGRVTLSYVRSHRTDPTTGIMAPAAFDVPHTFTAIARRPLGRGWTAGATVHAATGRPFTDVASATLDSVRHIWVPVYSTPMANRMPATFRTDVQLTRVHRFSQRRTWITYVSVNNLFDRDNLYTYRYSADYTRRIAVRSLFKRSFYVGMSLVQ